MKTDILRAAGAPPEAVDGLRKDLEEMAAERERLERAFQEAVREKSPTKVREVEEEVKRRISERIKSMESSELVAATVAAVANVNLLFSSKTGAPFFREDMKVASILHSPCMSPQDFNEHLGALATLFEVRLDPLRALLSKYEPQWKSVRLLEAWNAELGGGCIPASAFDTWKRIIAPRNATFPFHTGSAELIGLLQSFGEGFPVEYGRLWEIAFRGLAERITSEPDREAEEGSGA